MLEEFRGKVAEIKVQSRPFTPLAGAPRKPRALALRARSRGRRRATPEKVQSAYSFPLYLFQSLQSFARILTRSTVTSKWSAISSSVRCCSRKLRRPT